jgi:uncharacterized damage-inducible protein DinB
MQVDETETLLAFLDELRASVVRCVEGIGADQARRTLVPSGTSLVGLVRHLCEVENFWFRHSFAKEKGVPFYGRGDEAWSSGDEAEIDEALERYRDACAAGNRIVRGASSLDDLAARPYGDDQVSLRWIMVHMIEETARHAGHADILRELIDGETGR